eukprot:42635-Eustigmatos_ZCMA.PRE.1
MSYRLQDDPAGGGTKAVARRRSPFPRSTVIELIPYSYKASVSNGVASWGCQVTAKSGERPRLGASSYHGHELLQCRALGST